MSTARQRLVVYTARLHSVDDPDTLDITRRTADTHEKAIERWRSLSSAQKDEYRLDGLDRARAASARGMTLVQAQRLALDKGYPSLGAPWAPSWDLLKPCLAGLQLADHHGKRALALPIEERRAAFVEAWRLDDLAWDQYLAGWTRDDVTVPGFTDQMRTSYVEHRAAWRWMLGLDRIVLACLCRKPQWWPADRPWRHCHRYEVQSLLVKCGARDGGEIAEPDAPPSPQLGLAMG